jgi:hypothetical protein
MDFKETGWEGVKWIHLVQDKGQWQALVRFRKRQGIPCLTRRPSASQKVSVPWSLWMHRWGGVETNVLVYLTTLLKDY